MTKIKPSSTKLLLPTLGLERRDRISLRLHSSRPSDRHIARRRCDMKTSSVTVDFDEDSKCLQGKCIHTLPDRLTGSQIVSLKHELESDTTDAMDM